MSTIAGDGAPQYGGQLIMGKTYRDGIGTAARFNGPQGMAVDTSFNVYTADWNNHAIRVISASTGAVTRIAGTGYCCGADGTGTNGCFCGPDGMTIDRFRNLYLGSCGNHQIKKVTFPTYAVSTLGGQHMRNGFANGIGANTLFCSPQGMAVDGFGNVYVGDTCNYCVRKISPTNVVSTLGGMCGTNGYRDGDGTQALFSGLDGLGIDNSGWVYVADGENAVIRKISPEGVASTLAGTPRVSGFRNDYGLSAMFNNPISVTVNNTGSECCSAKLLCLPCFSNSLPLPPPRQTPSQFIHLYLPQACLYQTTATA